MWSPCTRTPPSRPASSCLVKPPKERPMAAVSPRAENERKIQTEEAKANHHTSKSVNMLDSLKFSWCLSLSLRIKSAWEERFPPPQRHSLGPGSLVQSPQWEQETESKRETVYLKCRLPPNPRLSPPMPISCPFTVGKLATSSSFLKYPQLELGLTVGPSPNHHGSSKAWMKFTFRKSSNQRRGKGDMKQAACLPFAHQIRPFSPSGRMYE